MIERAKFFLERVNFGRRINFHMLMEDAHGDKRSVAQPVVFQTLSENTAEMGQPLMQLALPDAQNLIDELWTVGLRPSQGHATEGQQGATTKHLEDMRAMVAKLAGVPLP